MSSRLEAIQVAEDHRINQRSAREIANRMSIAARAEKKSERLERRRLRRSGRADVNNLPDFQPRPLDLIAEMGEPFSTLPYPREETVVYSAQISTPPETQIGEISEALAHERQGTASKRIKQRLKDIRSSVINEFKLAFGPRT